MTLAEVAEDLVTTKAQVYALVRHGDLPAVKFGGRGQWRVERGRFEAWLEDKHAETRRFIAENPYPGGGLDDDGDAGESST